jgi:hypothetical protein
MFIKMLLLLIAIAVSVSSTVLTDVGFAFSAQVDAEWRLEKIDSSTLCIYNSDITKKTKLYIERIVVDTISVIKDNERAQMYFLSNYAVAKQYGIVQSFDSSTTLRQGSLRAYELYAYFKDTANGTNQWWAEISRWCAIENYVFELTVMGDTADVNNNGKRYKSMLNGIQVGYSSTKISKPVFFRFVQQPVGNVVDVYDLFGRKMDNGDKLMRCAATGCFVAPMRMTIKLR